MSTDNQSKIIVSHSYKGGTGKTSISINLAQYLAIKQNKRVLLIEQDVGGPSFENIFRIETEKTWNDFYNSNSQIKELISPLEEFDIICAKAEDIQIPQGQSPKTFYTRQLERLSMQKKWLTQTYDYIIIDTHPGYNYQLMNSLFIADRAILLTRLDVDTISRTIEMYNKIYSHFKEKKIVIVQNQVPIVKKQMSDTHIDLDIEKAQQKWKDFIADKILITIPLSIEIAYSLSRSKRVKVDHIFMKYIEQIANSL